MTDNFRCCCANFGGHQPHDVMDPYQSLATWNNGILPLHPLNANTSPGALRDGSRHVALTTGILRASRLSHMIGRCSPASPSVASKRSLGGRMPAWLLAICNLRQGFQLINITTVAEDRTTNLFRPTPRFQGRDATHKISSSGGKRTEYVRNGDIQWLGP
jgi:hypothetical protein